MENIREENYQVLYDDEQATVTFKGILRLRGVPDYDEIEALLQEAVSFKPETFTIDLQSLEYMNSSGITMLSMFVYNLSKKTDIKPIIQASGKHFWQTRLLKNLKQMVPNLELKS